MLISVIIPTYKPGDYIYECLSSLATQTLPQSEWEILLVLNGDKDPYYDSLTAYIQNSPLSNIQLHYSEIKGVSAARNLGLDLAQGEYITFIDDDDWVSPSYLEELLQHASPKTIALSNTIAFDQTNTNISYYISEEYKRCAKNGIQPYSTPRKYFSGPCMKLFHHDIIGKDRFDTRFHNGEDSLMMFQISPKMSWVDFTTEKAIYYRRIRPKSASNSTPIHYRIHNSTRLIAAYTQIFLRNKGHSFRFYLSRILGALHTVLVG